MKKRLPADFCPEGKVTPGLDNFMVCIDCDRRGTACSGPRTNALDTEEYRLFIFALFKDWGGTRQEYSEISGVSKSTIDDFFAGQRDVSRTTAGMLEAPFFGGKNRWPCSLRFDSDKETIYEDRPETLEALRLRNEQIEAQRRNYEDLKRSTDVELERVREEYRDDIHFYKGRINQLEGQLQHKDEQIHRRDKQLDRKDWYIDFLIKVANAGGDLKSIDLNKLEQIIKGDEQ